MAAKNYDYIIAGMGCAGLSLAMHLIKSGEFGDKSILLIDQQAKNKNDRTWCFWEKEPGLFEEITYRQWDNLWFFGEEFYKEFSIKPYRYKMIRGIDFYDYCLAEIKRQPNFEIRYAKVDSVFSETETGIIINGEKTLCNYVFNSILFGKPSLTNKQHWLLQHFKGWQITTEERTFDSYTATLMDFRISQQHGTSFCYLLPLSATEALVEYTLFTPDLLQDEEYDKELKTYIENILHITEYKVTGTEFGVIPMTNYPFKRRHNNIINMGTAGGQTKGSSGYTFFFIQKACRGIAESLEKTGKPQLKKQSLRFPFYDSVLLNILANNTLPGKEIFSTLFQKNKVVNVLEFLNNESSLLQDIKIISSLPTMPFLKAAIQQTF